MFDHAQSPRLGQPVAPESPGIRMFDGSDIPETSYTGQLIYRKDLQIIQVYNGVSWEEVVGGRLDRMTFVGDTAPVPSDSLHLNINDLWYDSDNNMALSIWNGTEWVGFVQDTTVTYSGGIITDDLVVQGGLSLQYTTNEIAKDSGLTLSQGTSSPIAAPSVVNDWDSSLVDTTTQVGPGTFGMLSLNPSNASYMGWHVGLGALMVAQPLANTRTRIFMYNRDGTLWFNSSTGTYGFFDLNIDLIGGLFSFASEVNVVYTGKDINNRWVIYGRKPNGTWGINVLPTGTSAVTTGQKTVTNVTDSVMGEYYLIEHVVAGGGIGGSNHVTIQRIRMSNLEGATASKVGSLCSSDSGMNSSTPQFVGAAYGTQSGGPTQLAALSTGQVFTRHHTIDNSTTAHEDDNYQFKLNGGVQTGFAHDGTNFYGLNSAGILTKHSNWMWTTANNKKAWMAVSFYDSIATTHETNIGTIVAQIVVKRSRLAVTVPQITAGVGSEVPDTFKLYGLTTDSSVTTTPVNSAFKYQATLGSTSATAQVIYRTDLATGTASPSPVPFPGGTAGQITGAALNSNGRPKFSVDGTGAGNWEVVAPTGSVSGWAGNQSAPPDGWLLCVGQVLSQTGTYASLYAVIGTTYNLGGEAAGTFRIPNSTFVLENTSKKHMMKY